MKISIRCKLLLRFLLPLQLTFNAKIRTDMKNIVFYILLLFGFSVGISADEEMDAETKAHIEAVMKAIATGDSVTFAKHLSYPFDRIYPMKNISNEREMQHHFNLLFDEKYRQKMAKSSLKNWEQVGWRGWMYNNGEIWISEYGISAINWSSKAYDELYDQLLKQEIAGLHPSVDMKGWIPRDCYEDLRNGNIYRIDYDKEGEKCRISIYPKGSKKGDKPQILLGKVDVQGTLRLVYLIYEGKDMKWMLDEAGGEDGILTFSFERGKTSYEHEITPCYFQDVMTEKHQGKAELAGHWYLPADKKVCMDFNRDSTFVFTDYNDKKKRYEKLRGVYHLTGNKLFLQYNDRKGQTFTYFQAPYASECFIKKGQNYCLIKEF